MRHKALTLAVAALLVFGASGIVAASMTTSPSPATADASPTDTASPANHTVDVIDPHDKLSAQEAENAWQLTWANDTIKSYFDNVESVHFQVEAIEDELQVLVATSDTAPPQVQAIVDLESETVTSVEELNNVATADEVKTMDLSPQNIASFNDSETMTVSLEYTTLTEIETADQAITMHVPPENLTVVEDRDSTRLTADQALQMQIPSKNIAVVDSDLADNSSDE